MPSRRERVISLLASIILCSCLACSVSFIAGNSGAGFGIKASEPSIRTASVYGAPTLASLFAHNASSNTHSSEAKVKGASPDTADTSRDEPAAGVDGADGAEEELRQLGAANAEGAGANLLVGSIVLMGLSILAITVAAAVGITVLAPRLWRRRSGGSSGAGIGGEYKEGRKLASSASLGTHDSISL